MKPCSGTFASGTAWWTIVFKVSAFSFFCQKMKIETVCLENPKLNHNNHYSVCAVFTVSREHHIRLSAGLCDIIRTTKMKYR